MFILSQVELVYVGQGVAENGSPVQLETTNVVRCQEMETFSINYYDEQQRNMRQARNLVVPTYLTKDVDLTGIKYELMYCIYDGKKYRIRNILKMRGTRQRMILDIQEVR